MNETEIAGCLIRIQAAWPAEWDTARQWVWADHLQDLNLAEVTTALKRMETETDYPTIASLYEALRAGPDGGVRPAAELLERMARDERRTDCPICEGEGVEWDETGAVKGLCSCQ